MFLLWEENNDYDHAKRKKNDFTLLMSLLLEHQDILFHVTIISAINLLSPLEKKRK